MSFFIFYNESDITKLKLEYIRISVFYNISITKSNFIAKDRKKTYRHDTSRYNLYILKITDLLASNGNS